MVSRKHARLAGFVIALAGLVACAAPSEDDDVDATGAAQRTSAERAADHDDARTADERLRDGRCLHCHKVDHTLVGPALRDVADRYRRFPRESTVERLTTKLTRGGSGAWGFVPMPENPYVTTDEARWLAEWILDLEPIDADAGAADAGAP